MDPLYKAQEEAMAARVEEQAAQQAAAKCELAESGEKYMSLNRLVLSEDFQSFLAKYVGPLVNAQRAAALDRTKTPEQRTIALEILDFGEKILALAEQQRDYWKNKATTK